MFLTKAVLFSLNHQELSIKRKKYKIMILKYLFKMCPDVVPTFQIFCYLNKLMHFKICGNYYLNMIIALHFTGLIFAASVTVS